MRCVVVMRIENERLEVELRTALQDRNFLCYDIAMPFRERARRELGALASPHAVSAYAADMLHVALRHMPLQHWLDDFHRWLNTGREKTRVAFCGSYSLWNAPRYEDIERELLRLYQAHIIRDRKFPHSAALHAFLDRVLRDGNPEPRGRQSMSYPGHQSMGYSGRQSVGYSGGSQLGRSNPLSPDRRGDTRKRLCCHTAAAALSPSPSPLSSPFFIDTDPEYVPNRKRVRREPSPLASPVFRDDYDDEDGEDGELLT